MVKSSQLTQACPGWPEAAQLDAVVTSGQPAYGMAAVGPGKMSPGAEAIILATDRNDSRPLWITIWGGANTLAQALQHVRATRSSAEVDSFLAKLRVYSISDQDDAGPWIRREFPNLHYIVKPSSPDSGEYASATWTGISGDVYYRNCMGADGSTVTNDWLETNIRANGPLGKFYPKFAFIMEGDTPAFLGLTNNGLNSYRNPSWAAGAALRLAAPLWRDASNMDTGWRSLPARYIAGQCNRSGRQNLCLGSGDDLALADSVSA